MAMFICGTLFSLLCLSIVSVHDCVGEVNVKGKAVEVDTTFPERLDEKRQRRDLSTLNEAGHDHEATFRVKAFNKELVLDVKLNKNLISPSFTVGYFHDDGSEIMKRDKQSNCYYQGNVRNKHKSLVILNTCKGLSGLIDDSHETYYIEPKQSYQDNGAHKIYPADDDQIKFDHHKCGNNGGLKRYDRDADESSMKRNRKHSYWYLRDVDEFYTKYLTTNETRYNELLFVADYRMYLEMDNDTAALTERVIILANAVDAIYQRINIRVVLVALEIWNTGDPYVRSRNAGKEVNEFTHYRNRHLVPKYHHDNAHLLSSWGWPGILGMAWLSATCGGLSTGINNWSRNWYGLLGPYGIVAHEMGHNFGMNHDAGSCTCLTRRGCIMGGRKARLPGFSNCSMNGLKGIDDTCLYNVPVKAINSKCGNGIKEQGEECDCGTPEMCKKDPCCEPNNCKLRVKAQCSDLHHVCCRDCLFKKQGTLCRREKSDCDTPEYCAGDSGDCPADEQIRDGYPCNSTTTLIVGNKNRHGVVIKHLKHRITARYVRFNPRYWKNWPCMRTELFGCSVDEVNPTSPTPIRAYNDHCIQPQSAACHPPEDNRLIYKNQRGSGCEEDFKQFTLDADGVLRHHCSGKGVCPLNGGSARNTPIVISSKCSDDDSKYVRTSGKSLKHLKTGMCVHPRCIVPRDNCHWVLWDACDHPRLELWFLKPDCVIPLGLQSGKIKDDQISASSSRRWDPPRHARLHYRYYWCPRYKGKTEYVQIDLGQIKTISSVATQGRSTANDWVTGYYLYYSTDGQRWTALSESGDSLHSNSFCYQGKCSKTHDTQCRDLWGATAQSGTKDCYDKLNTNNKENKGYGTCSAVSHSPCKDEHAQCGQLQCLDTRSSPDVDYGYNYTQLSLPGGVKCSAAKLKFGDAIGLGMVRDGTKCGIGKMCVGYKCQDIKTINLKKCPIVNGKECAGRGVCLTTVKCHCDVGYDPASGCSKPFAARDGKWSLWSDWSACSKPCGRGKITRYRFCANPFPAHGGKDCVGIHTLDEDCNTKNCPKVFSCRHLQLIGNETNRSYPDGVYVIYPTGPHKPIKAYCDMSRDGGGWTLLVASHTNTWTADNVRLRNTGTPQLYGDYSILIYADSIKNNVNILSRTFEYRLEAQSRGRWGGIWQASKAYSFLATTNKQTNVKLITKFDDWKYSDRGIEQRMPWISGAKLTTSESAVRQWWGSITGDEKNLHPAPWIYNYKRGFGIAQPDYIWYWMREGSFEEPAKPKHPFFESERAFEPVGCFRDSEQTRALPVLLANFRSKINWKKRQEIVLYCAKAAKSAGYVYFAIQYWGECWTSRQAHVTYDMYGESRAGCWRDTVGKERHNFVYRLTGTADHECHSKVYKTYKQADRSRFAGSGNRCDLSSSQHVPGWYRFTGGAGNRMATTCVARGHCSTDLTGWYSGKLPEVLEGVATGRGCFSQAANTADSSKCCSQGLTVDIKVQHCGRFYVWKLPATKACSSRYCGAGRPNYV